jgi:hypothetical protein
MKNLGDIMKQAQRMKAEMDRIQAEVAARTVEGSAGGGMVTAVANGKGELLSVRIDPEAVKGEDIEMLQDLVAAAVNDALRKARELLTQEVSRLAGGLNLPGLF